jgi:hypothetical protein
MLKSLLKKDTPIHFVIDQSSLKERLTWDDLETIELMQSGARPWGRLKLFAAHFMVDDAGAYLAEDKALKVLGKLTLADMEGTLTKFWEAFNGMTINPQSGNPSTLPTEAGPATDSLPGSKP